MKEGFSCKESKTCELDGQEDQNIFYGIGTTFGTVVHDKIGFDQELFIENVKFLIASDVNQSESLKDLNGIFGMAPTNIEKNTSSFTKLLKDNDKIEEMIFSIYFSLNVKKKS